MEAASGGERRGRKGARDSSRGGEEGDWEVRRTEATLSTRPAAAGPSAEGAIVGGLE